ncbi:DUF5677 domain-containing protein [Variovorax boronicumulans]|uniref:DUF5677 domain-containing protein n=1 Tax=Variovorax boronicumulans TaxID=436515 RepID=UPI003395CF4E
MKKLRVIEDAIDHALSVITSPEKLLPLALAKVAKKRELNLSEVELQNLTAALLSAEGDVLRIDVDPSCGLGKTPEEIRETIEGLFDELKGALKELGDDLVEAAVGAIPNALANVAEIIGDRLSEQAADHAIDLRRVQSVRAEMVQRIWGDVIERLDFLGQLVLEWNQAAAGIGQGAYAKINTEFALGKLVARAYEITGEITVLARAGYADGALARWRSLHEVCVVAMFVSGRSDMCAQMYLSHHQVEELRLLEHNRTSGVGRVDAHRDRRASHLRRQKAAMVNRFGAAFAKDYGWASVELGCGRTTFRDLENHVGLDTLRRGYEQANNTIHGGPLAALTRISLDFAAIDGNEIPLAYGCEVAINYATASLSMLVAELCVETENADLLALNMVVQNHAREIWNQIEQERKKISGRSPRERILDRKAEQRENRKRRVTYPKASIRR